MAGAGYKLFNTGDVLTAQQVNEYLMQQTVMVFANASARTTALSGILAEGMLSYLQDTNKVYVYDGSAWLDVSSEIPSQTGNSGKYLTTDGTTASWGTVAAGSNWSLLNSGGTALSGSQTVTISSISGKDKIMILVKNASGASNYAVGVRINGDTASNYYRYGIYKDASADFRELVDAAAYANLGTLGANGDTVSGYCLITGANSSGVKVLQVAGTANMQGYGGDTAYIYGGYYNSSSTVSSVSLYIATGNFDAGTIWVYASA